MTAESVSECTECLIEEILLCYQCLSEVPTLDPSPTVDRLFGELVRLCSSQTIDEATVAMVGPPPLLLAAAKKSSNEIRS